MLKTVFRDGSRGDSMTETKLPVLRTYTIQPNKWKKIAVPYLREWALIISSTLVRLHDSKDDAGDNITIDPGRWFGNRLSTEDVELEFWFHNPSGSSIAYVTLAGW